jgi:hypothetical protein
MSEPLPTSPLNIFEEEIRFERCQQDKKWGQQDHPDGTGRPGSQELSNYYRAVCQANGPSHDNYQDILAEEIFEAFAETDPVRLYNELTQAEAVIRQWREALRRRDNHLPVKVLRDLSCRYLHKPCRICDHSGCSFCPDCSPEVPDL